MLFRPESIRKWSYKIFSQKWRVPFPFFLRVPKHFHSCTKARSGDKNESILPGGIYGERSETLSRSRECIEIEEKRKKLEQKRVAYEILIEERMRFRDGGLMQPFLSADGTGERYMEFSCWWGAKE